MSGRPLWAPSWTSVGGCGASDSGKYEAAFRENEINEKVLPNLTAEDLKDMGVSIVGHRRALLDAITALRTDATAKGLPEAPSTIEFC